MPELMQWEKDVIMNSMVSKSSREISALLGVDAKRVSDYICSAIAVPSQRRIRRSLREKLYVSRRSPVKKKKKEKVRITSARIDHVIPFKHLQRSYKTRQQDFTLLIPVKIDHKTYIYVKPGSDIEKVKQDFINNIEKSKTFSLTKK
jgi:hypothetical protein